MQSLAELGLPSRPQELRDTWQGRALALAQGRMMIAIASILAHSYDDAMPFFFREIKPRCWDAGRRSLKTPFLCSAGKVNKLGQIVADAILHDGAIKQTKVIFSSERDFEFELRKLADALKLTDAERIELFVIARKWVVADQRLDPTMDPKDPDAKRLVLH